MDGKYFVVLRRLFQEKEVISIYDKEEAIAGNWIQADGERVWVVPPTEEKTITFVWAFNDLDVAVMFYECLQHNELGIKCEEV